MTHLSVDDGVPGMRAEDEPTSAVPCSRWDRANAVLRRTILVVALLYLAVYVTIALFRLGHPFELEWMEGGIVDHVRKVVEHRPLYAKPSLSFVSFFYPPFYYWVGAAVSSVLGIGFLPLRLASFLSSV